MFSDECAKAVDVLGYTIDISSGTGSALANGTLTSPLNIKSDSARAIKSIIIDFNSGERVTITNSNLVKAEKPAGEIIHYALDNGQKDIRIPESYSCYRKKVSKVEFKLSGDAPSLGAYILKESGDTGWNTGHTRSEDADGIVYTFTASQINAVDVEVYGIGFNPGVDVIKEVLLTFTDGTTLTIINSAASNSVSFKSVLRNALSIVRASLEEGETADPSDGIPTGAVKVGDSVILDGSETKPWYTQWNDLPYADSNGNTYYYYVKEENSGGYIFVGYDSNGQLSLTEPEIIEVHNASDEQPTTANITVNKIWRDGLSDDTDRPNVEVKLYRSTNENETNFTEENLVAGSAVTLNSENE